MSYQSIQDVTAALQRTVRSFSDAEAFAALDAAARDCQADWSAMAPSERLRRAADLMLAHDSQPPRLAGLELCQRIELRHGDHTPRRGCAAGQRWNHS